MTEDDGQTWLAERLGVSAERMAQLETFRKMVLSENAKQNLISGETQDHVWVRHIVDSAQLLLFGPADANSWLDLGTGAGFPGMVIAILRDCPITFVESRRRRVEFLQAASDQLGLANVRVAHSRLEAYPSRPFDVITARAFAPIDRLLSKAHRFAQDHTIWLLPKGKSAYTEIEAAKQEWRGVFHVKQSVTDLAAGIIIASAVKARQAP